MKGVYGRVLRCVCVCQVFLMVGLVVGAQEWMKPIRNTTSLSGNFGELRATHFHSGIDIRTGGVEGLPVICVQDGIVSRVSVSPTGYGLALYVEHPNGKTTVYGHLQRFIPKISQIVRELQYQQESFKIDEPMKAYQLFFRRGDTIAYSGNSGSSGGPHLHFEVRNTHTEHALNPLSYYRVEDTQRPQVKRITLYEMEKDGQIKVLRNCPVKEVGNGRYEIGCLNVPVGKIGLGLLIVDRMNSSMNKLGVYDLSVVAGRDTVFGLRMDSCSFDQKMFINAVKDFDSYKKYETVYRCFGHRQNEFMGARCRHEGGIEVGKDSVVKVKIDLADMNGNRSVVRLELKGMGEGRRVVDSNVLRYDQAHTLEMAGGRLVLEKDALHASVKKYLQVKKDTSSGQNVFIFAEKEVPLFKKGRLFIEGTFGDGALICEVDQAGRRYPLATTRKENGLEAEVGYLSRYTVVCDRVMPTISYLGVFPGRVIRFRIKDNFSGIASYRGEVNGEWCLFSYDPRTAVMEASLLESAFRKGRDNQVKVVVEDVAGNRNEVAVIVRF